MKKNDFKCLGNDCDIKYDCKRYIPVKSLFKHFYVKEYFNKENQICVNFISTKKIKQETIF